MESQENPVTRPSGLRPPSKIPPPSPVRCLQEMSASDGNSRAVMPPPGLNNKHKISGLPEPTTKVRKTLAERAGEPSNSNIAAPPSLKPLSSSVRSTLQNGVRTGNLSASVSSRLPSSSSVRTASTASHSSSVGTAPRPGTSLARPKTAMSHTRTKSKVAAPGSRPATAMDDHAVAKDPPSIGKRKAWDTKGRLEDMENMYSKLLEKMDTSMSQKSELQETIGLYKAKFMELESAGSQLSVQNTKLQSELESTKEKLIKATLELENAQKMHSYEIEELKRNHRRELEDIEEKHRRETEYTKNRTEREAERVSKEFQEQVDNLMKLHKGELEQLERRLTTELEEERSKRTRELQELASEHALKLQNAGLEFDTKERELQKLRTELSQLAADHEREKAVNKNLQATLADTTTQVVTLEAQMKSARAKAEFLESDNQAQSEAFAELNRRMQEAIDEAARANEKLRAEETLRRKLHNQVQELKGNIRVFCRVRPPLGNGESDPAKITFPDADADAKEVVVQGPEQKTAMGNSSASTNAFSFDRVFGPSSQNAEIFEEISQLVQSALDGYNVCIFCYGQTGSGKTFTMSTPVDGMIPRATQQIYAEASRLEEKGWKYSMEGSFIEVYNETLNDLLGKPEDFDKKKLEIRHDTAKKQTYVQDANTVPLDSPDRVEEILRRAAGNRRVAATKANERSSRSHSVFILKLKGENSITNERSEGTLNLVDLAGSERLSHSQVEGARLKETQNINRSLSCLGDVIAALGQGKEGGHIPYRNSKLTYLLQYSLGGNSKTLMFVMISPLREHLQETITSLKFATKVHNTHIGTAKKQSRVKD